ncbi:PucR family transcriptional regulator [Sporolactobacillus terrae]|uniref:PucR family transcriptional regulator n=1 Tax=Sporolactobacillus terrae TaxID=269673 RepID=UPI00048CDD0C|nr:PucR family transcriptional regulator [Sporolactobacillus terrae]
MITLKHLFTLPEFSTIKLVAGEAGMSRVISGVNVMESDCLFDFFKEGELLVTTGINMDHDEAKLIAMVKQTYAHRASGVILNVGPYIPSIPDEVIAFANRHRFPLLSMPWSYRVADFVKITVQFLAVAEQNQSRSRHLLPELLFQSVPDRAYLTAQLDRMGAQLDQSFSIVVCSDESEHSFPASLVYGIERELSRKYRLLQSMRREDQLIYLTVQMRGSDVKLSKLVAEIRTKQGTEAGKLSIGCGSDSPILEVQRSYQEALTVLRLAKRHPYLKLCAFNELGAYRILMDVREPRVIESFYQKYLGLLYRYDQLHETDFVPFLRVFLEEDGRTANIAQKEFIHRNTVLYKVKKIEAILGTDLAHPFVKTNLQLAFMIEDLMR